MPAWPEDPSQEDPVSLLSAAARLRWGRRPSGRGEAGLRLAASRLLETVAAATARDRASVPAGVRRAAAALAAEAPRQRRLTAAARAPSTPRRAQNRTPFTSSIRLGRMG